MAQQITPEEVQEIFDAAKSHSAGTGLGKGIEALSPVGACIATTYGNPQSCRPLTQGECTYVSSELEKRNAGFAKWQPGDCTI
jgi:hypothetical protein